MVDAAIVVVEQTHKKLEQMDTATAAGRSEHKGQVYFFCSSKCKEKFDRNPEQYLSTSAGTPKSDHSCCG